MKQAKAIQMVENFEKAVVDRHRYLHNIAQSGHHNANSSDAYFERHEALINYLMKVEDKPTPEGNGPLFDFRIEWGVGPINQIPNRDEVMGALDMIKKKAKRMNVFVITVRLDMAEYLEKNLKNVFIRRIHDEDDGLIDIAIGTDEATVDDYVSRI